MTIWVTGAGGFIGRHLVRHLAAQGERVCGIDLMDAGAAGLAEHICGWSGSGITPDALTALVSDSEIPDTIYHLAGGSAVGPSFANPWADFSATLGGTATLLEWMRNHAPAARLVIVSSAAVYGNLYADPIPEDALTAPFSPYGAHKYAMEVLCRGWAGSFGLNIVAVRLFSVFGAGLAKQLLWDLCGKLANVSETVTLGGSGNELRDWTYVDDVVRALCAVVPLAGPTMPVVNAGSGRAGSVRSIAECVVAAFGRDPDCLQFSGQSRPGDPFSLVAAPGKLAGAGFEWRIGLAEGIADYVRWFQDQNGAS